MKKHFLFLVFLVYSLDLWSKNSEILFKKGTLKIAGHTLQVEIAESEEEHAHGLMFRKKMPANHGMIFIFKDSRMRKFWMKNTLIPLSIAYFDENQTLVDLKDMKPGTLVEDEFLPSYPSAEPAKFAVEVNQGWFRKKKIKKGAKFILDRL